MGELTEKQKNSPLYKYYVRDIAPAPADIVERVKNRDFGEVPKKFPKDVSVKLRHRPPMRNDTNCFPHILISRWNIF